MSKFSSQLQDNRWSAAQVIGPQRIYPNHEDNELAWAPHEKGQQEFLELEFQEPVFVTSVVIYETFHPGSVRTISVRAPDGSWQPVYQASKVDDIRLARKFRPRIKRPQFEVNEIRIDFDCSVCQESVQIDAVQLIGYSVYKAETEPLDQQLDSVSFYSLQNSCFILISGFVSATFGVFSLFSHFSQDNGFRK